MDSLHDNILEQLGTASKNPGKPLITDANRMAGPLRPEAYTQVIKAFFPCQEAVELPLGTYILRLGVRDNSTGLIGTTNAALEIAAGPGAETGKLQEKKP